VRLHVAGDLLDLLRLVRVDHRLVEVEQDVGDRWPLRIGTRRSCHTGGTLSPRGTLYAHGSLRTGRTTAAWRAGRTPRPGRATGDPLRGKRLGTAADQHDDQPDQRQRSNRTQLRSHCALLLVSARASAITFSSVSRGAGTFDLGPMAGARGGVRQLRVGPR